MAGFTRFEASSGELPGFGKLGIVGKRTGDTGEKSTPLDTSHKASNALCPLNQPNEVHEPPEEGGRDSSVVNYDRLISQVSYRIQDTAELGMAGKSFPEIAVLQEQDGEHKPAAKDRWISFCSRANTYIR